MNLIPSRWNLAQIEIILICDGRTPEDPSLLNTAAFDKEMNLLKEYDAYILKNAAQISSIESALRTITYILPSIYPIPFHLLTTGRFKDAELASETCLHHFNILLTCKCIQH